MLPYDFQVMYFFKRIFHLVFSQPIVTEFRSLRTKWLWLKRQHVTVLPNPSSHSGGDYSYCYTKELHESLFGSFLSPSNDTNRHLLFGSGEFFTLLFWLIVDRRDFGLYTREMKSDSFVSLEYSSSLQLIPGHNVLEHGLKYFLKPSRNCSLQMLYKIGLLALLQYNMTTDMTRIMG